MKTYPILFGYRDPVFGAGFVAEVSSNGRALLVEDAGEFWMYGVNPGGISAGGRSRDEAISNFRTAYRATLYDIASGSESFEEFREEVTRFFNEVSQDTVQEWKAATEAVARSEVDTTWLQVKKADQAPLGVEVAEIEQPRPEQNALDVGPLAACA